VPISAPVPHISPSAIAAFESPIASIAPSWNTGKYAVVPVVMSVVSRLPPWSSGVSVETDPPAVATPIVPITGSIGTSIPEVDLLTRSLGVHFGDPRRRVFDLGIVLQKAEPGGENAPGLR